MSFLSAIVLPFLLGFLGFVKIGFIGSVSANEVLLVAVMPFYFNRMLKFLQHRQLRRLLLLGGLYLLALIVADLYRQTPAEDYLRGWTRVGFTLLCMVALGAILTNGSKGAWLPFLLGWFMAPLGSILLYGIQFEPYKFYFAGLFSSFSFMIVGYLPVVFKQFTYALPLTAAAFAFMYNARSAAGVTLLTFFVIVFASFRLRSPKRLSRNPFFVLAILAIGGLGILQFYSYAASRGYLGDAVYDKYISQVALGGDNIVSLLFAGRVEIYFMWPKIFESPIIGYGSWPKDWIYTQGRATDLQLPSLAGILGSQDLVDAGLIPTHSHIMGAWLEAGIIGAIFWGYTVWLAYKVVTGAAMASLGKLRPIFIYVLVTFAWDVWFSPFGGERRLWNGFVLAWIITTASQNKSNSRMPGSHQAGPSINLILPITSVFSASTQNKY
jgi:hypothetical protein